MNTDTQSGQISDQNQPAVAVRLVGYIFPFQNQPEYNGCKEGGESIYFAFYGREPEGVAEGVDQCADQSATHDSDKLSFRDVVLVGDYQFAYQMGDAPEKEQDTGTAHQCAHVVYHLRYGGYIGGELREQVRYQHEERCAGRVSYFQFITGSYKLGTVPKTCGRFYCQAVDRCRNDECNPTHEVVYSSVLFH